MKRLIKRGYDGSGWTSYREPTVGAVYQGVRSDEHWLGIERSATAVYLGNGEFNADGNDFYEGWDYLVELSVPQQLEAA